MDEPVEVQVVGAGILDKSSDFIECVFELSVGGMDGDASISLEYYGKKLESIVAHIDLYDDEAQLFAVVNTDPDFVARYQEGEKNFLELSPTLADAILTWCRKTFTALKQNYSAEIAKHPEIANLPGEEPDLDSVAGRLVVLKRELHSNVTKKDEPAVCKAFGGEVPDYVFNFRMYQSRVQNGPVTLHVPPEDYYRLRFDALSRTGLVPQGASLPPALLLEGLPIRDLRAIAKTIDASIKLSSKKAGAAKIMAAVDDVMQLFPVDYAVEDFFRLELVSLDDIRERFGQSAGASHKRQPVGSGVKQGKSEKTLLGSLLKWLLILLAIAVLLIIVTLVFGPEKGAQ